MFGVKELAPRRKIKKEEQTVMVFRRNTSMFTYHCHQTHHLTQIHSINI